MRLISHLGLRRGDVIVENAEEVRRNGKEPETTEVRRLERGHCSAQGTHVNNGACWTSPVWIL